MSAALWVHLWQSTLVALLVAALALALRRHSARLRFALWLAASLKFLFPFAGLVALGRLLRPAPAAARLVAPAMAVALRGASASLLAGQTWLSRLPAPAAPSAVDWLRALAPAAGALWWCGVMLVAAWRLRSWRRVRALLRASTPAAPPAGAWPAGWELRTCAALREPGVAGWRRPVLLLPAGLREQLEPSQFEAVLAHEWCHVRRRDNLAAAAHMVVEALFWFHPMVWWIGARMVEERERACDEAVLRLGSAPRVYAEGILNVCRWGVEPPPSWMAGVAGAGLKRRLMAILSPRRAARLGWPGRLALAAVGFATLLVPLAVGAMRQAAPPPRFDVVSIHEWTPTHRPGAMGRVGVQRSPGRLYSQCASLRTLLSFAYKLTLSTPIVGMPSWGNAACGDETVNTFTLEATMPASTSEVQARLMMQDLLATRFGLKIHWETKLGKVWALELAPGAKPRPWNPKADDKPIPPRSIGCPAADRACQNICCGGGTMADLANLLGPLDGRPVIDRTGLRGDYPIQMTWAGAFTQNSPLPSLAAALRTKGLVLQSELGPIPSLYIDHVAKPAPN